MRSKHLPRQGTARSGITGENDENLFAPDVSAVYNKKAIKSTTIVSYRFVGEDGNEKISINEWADILGTINYELTCRLKVRLSRVYVR